MLNAKLTLDAISPRRSLTMKSGLRASEQLVMHSVDALNSSVNILNFNPLVTLLRSQSSKSKVQGSSRHVHHNGVHHSKLWFTYPTNATFLHLTPRIQITSLPHLEPCGDNFVQIIPCVMVRSNPRDAPKRSVPPTPKRRECSLVKLPFTNYGRWITRWASFVDSTKRSF